MAFEDIIRAISGGGGDITGGTSENAPGGNILNSLGDNSDLLSIVLDAVGSRLNPTGAFAGIGQALGQSGIAAKAEKERRTTSKSKFAELIKVLSGNTGIMKAENIGKDGEDRFKFELNPGAGPNKSDLDFGDAATASSDDIVGSLINQLQR